MIFSKSFGYALRGVLFIAWMQDMKRYVQLEEIALKLRVPHHFMGKVLKGLVKKGILTSTKGPRGGYTVNEHTLETLLMDLASITEGAVDFEDCVLRFNECSSANPCPLHKQMQPVKNDLKRILTHTTVGQLLNKDKAGLINSILSADVDFGLIE